MHNMFVESQIQKKLRKLALGGCGIPDRSSYFIALFVFEVYIWPRSKIPMLGMVIPPLIGNPYNGDINPYYWVDDESIPHLAEL